MVSQLGWVDFSSEDRDKVKQALALAAEKGTLDELGIGQIRDAYADLLCPGLSTIQTRAKYFITVPRLLRDYRQLKSPQRKPYKDLLDYLRHHENELVKTLVNKDPGEKGIIGQTSMDQGGVKRLPSEIYWNGMRTFGLVKTSSSLPEFSRMLDSHHEGLMISRDNEADQSDVKRYCELPDNDPQWMDDEHLTIHLSKKEAEFLKEKMVNTDGVRHSLISQLFQHDLYETALDLTGGEGVFEFDVLADLLLTNDDVDEEPKANLQLARDFSLAMQGPHIVLNILLAEKNGTEEQLDTLKQQFEHWEAKARNECFLTAVNVDQWLSVSVDQQARNIKAHTRQFIRGALEAFNQPSACLEQMSEVVSQQSIKNKKNLSLLKKSYIYENWVGVQRLDFRWGTAKIMIRDIDRGLSNVKS